MYTWIFFVIAGQFLSACAVLLDRYIVGPKKILSPVVYAFYVSLFSGFVLVLLPFGVVGLPTNRVLILSVVSAVTFVASIFFLYKSLETSRPFEVAPVIGGIAALSTFFFSYLLLDQGLPHHFIPAFLVLTLGMLLISHFEFSFQSFISLTISGVAFGLSTTFIKMLFADGSFIDGFFWSRMANVFVALLILLIPGVWKHLHTDSVQSPARGKLFVVLNKLIGAGAFLLILFAIRNGEVAFVNALAATQYVFLFIFALLFGSVIPDFIDTKVHKHEILHKVIAIFLIITGFFILFL